MSNLQALSTGSKLLTKKEVARHLRVCVRTVEHMVERGELPQPIRFSLRTIRWRSEDLCGYQGTR